MSFGRRAANSVCNHLDHSQILTNAVALACEDTFYVLRFSREAYDTALSTGEGLDEDGVEAAFEVVTDQSEVVTSGCWVGDCFVYTTSTNRLNYLVGEKSYLISNFDVSMYILGYLARDGRIYICDKDMNVISFLLSLALVEFQTLVLRGELETAMEMLPDVAPDQRNKVARFLEGQGYKDEAFSVSTDPEHRFELALALGRLDDAHELAEKADEEHKWRLVGDAALSAFDIARAEGCFWASKDLGSLLLLYSASNDEQGLRKLAARAKESQAYNVLFDCLWLLGDVTSAITFLQEDVTGRKAEAALLALTYKPSLAPTSAKAWKQDLEGSGKGRVSRALGVPPGTEGYAAEGEGEGWEEWEAWLEREKDGKGIDDVEEPEDVNEENGVEGDEPVLEENGVEDVEEVEEEEEEE
jgi:coatomer subunit beta'